MKIGVLAVQGAFIEHEKIIESLGAACIEIRKKEDLDGIDGVILPGGESTVQGQLLQKLDILAPLRALIKDGLPTLATCAGLILLASNIDEDPTVHLGTLPVTVKRNAYGRQLSSFLTNADFKPIGNVPMMFIRAPYVVQANDDVDILSEVDGRIVTVKYHNQIGLAFHPELTEDTRIHQYFLDVVTQNRQSLPW